VNPVGAIDEATIRWRLERVAPVLDEFDVGLRVEVKAAGCRAATGVARGSIGRALGKIALRARHRMRTGSADPVAVAPCCSRPGCLIFWRWSSQRREAISNAAAVELQERGRACATWAARWVGELLHKPTEGNATDRSIPIVTHRLLHQ
jgi:hypothetical protein